MNRTLTEAERCLLGDALLIAAARYQKYADSAGAPRLIEQFLRQKIDALRLADEIGNCEAVEVRA